MLKKKTLHIPIYKHWVYVRLSDKLPRSEHEAYVEFPDRWTCILHIKPSATPGTIAHEVVHIVNYIFEQCAMQPDFRNDEPQAYLTGWLVEEITKFVKP